MRQIPLSIHDICRNLSVLIIERFYDISSQFSVPVAKQVPIAKVQVVTYELSFIKYLILGYCLETIGSYWLLAIWNRYGIKLLISQKYVWLLRIDVKLNYLSVQGTFAYYESM